jgi:hypothetical protein
MEAELERLEKLEEEKKLEEERKLAEQARTGWTIVDPDHVPKISKERIVEHYCGKETVDTWILGRKPVGVVIEDAHDPVSGT